MQIYLTFSKQTQAQTQWNLAEEL